MGRPLVELDKEIEREAGISLSEVLSALRPGGLPANRATLPGACDQQPGRYRAHRLAAVLFRSRETYNLLLLNCYTVWVKAAPEEHMSRVIEQGDMRPMAGHAEAMEDLRNILVAREPLYGKARCGGRYLGSHRRVELRSLAAGAHCRMISQARLLSEFMRKVSMAQAAGSLSVQDRQRVTFDAHPDSYRHWKLSFDGPVATLALDVDENAGLRPGYKLKLNSYDLGVDIELHDAVQRIRFEHPSRCVPVVLTIAKDAGDRYLLLDAPIFSCWACRRTHGRLTFASSRTKHATDWKHPSRILRAEISSRLAMAPPRAAATSWRWPVMR